MSYIDQSVALLQSPAFENAIPFMYLDTRGLVTGGVGQMLRDAAAACQLPFQSPHGGIADLDSVIADWKRVKAMEAGHSPSFYHSDSSPTLLASDITTLLRSRVVGFDGQLQGYYPHYNSFPDAVKLALLDMIFNLGFGGLLKYPSMNAAINSGDWLGAANQCHRNGPSEARNEWTKNQFLSAAGDVPMDAAEAQSGSMIVRTDRENLAVYCLGMGLLLESDLRQGLCKSLADHASILS